MDPTIENLITVISARDWITGEVTAESALTDLGFDHLDEIELMLECEEEFQADFKDDDMLNVLTVSEFHQAILASFVA